MSTPALKPIIPTTTLPAPRGVADTGLPFGFLLQLTCKTLFFGGNQRLADLAFRLKLPGRIVEEMVEFLRREHLCDISSNSTSAQRFFTLTEKGRLRAEEYLRINQYAGPAPVSLEAYCAQVRAQAVCDLVVTHDDMRRAFQGVVVSDDLLDQFGAAMNSGRAMFVHGPAGAGKSFLAEHLAGLLGGAVDVPYAVLVQDQVIQIFDLNVHVPVDEPAAEAPGSVTPITGDKRWVKCHRPAVICGGELNVEMLDLHFDHSTRFYAAPPQLKANNGLLIIDDLGRQRVSARDLMNRWIVPMDRQRDYLALHTGEKFSVPFDVVLVFCTNLSPDELADEAFLRRLGYKIALEPLNEAQYRRVCRDVCQAMGIGFDDDGIDSLIARFRAEDRPLLACTPRDLLGQVRDQARYQGKPAAVTPELLDWAWKNYFVARPASSSLPV